MGGVILALACGIPSLAVGDDANSSRQDELANWSRTHVSAGWPLSNAGDPALSDVVFLYDVAIAAQARLAAGHTTRHAHCCCGLPANGPGPRVDTATR